MTFRDIKSNAEKISSIIIDNAEKAGTGAVANAKEIGAAVIKKTGELGSVVMDKAKEISVTVKDKAKIMAEEIKDSQAGSHKVIMLGGRRSGKTSVLACIIDQMANNTPGDICSVIQVDQGHVFYDENNNSYTMPTLYEKMIEVQRFVSGHKLSNDLFVVDMTPSPYKGSYYIQIKTGGSAEMSLEFVDVPGEFMEAHSKSHAYLEDQISKSDLFIITIDTPFLMEADDAENIIYNRVDEITASMQKMKIENEYDKKFILFCPVKCEKWLHAGQGEMVADKVCKVYRTLINSWVQHSNVTMWIMPVETAGGIEFCKFMDASRVFKSDDDRMGTPCSVDPNTEIIRYRNGKTEIKQESYRFEEDTIYQEQFNTIVPIPLPWYKANGKEFVPRLCEQPVYHFLRFLAEKEKSINEAKLRRDKDVSWWEKFKRFFTGYKSPFGKYAKEFSDMVDKIRSENLLKESGDGFRKLTTTIK